MKYENTRTRFMQERNEKRKKNTRQIRKRKRKR